MTVCQRLIRTLQDILDIIAPRPCEMCGRRLAAGEQTVCTACNATLPRTADNLNPYDNNTARLFWGRIPIEKCAAFVRYQPHTQFAQLIYRMKYGGRDDIAEQLGIMIADEYKASGFFDGIDTIVPMPLHPKRLRQRGYNQSHELACGISRRTGIPVDGSIIGRIRNTKSQTTMKSHERPHNMDGAFALKDGTHAAGKHLLLVDDIVTTGATLAACAEELAKINNVKISILTIGHTE